MQRKRYVLAGTGGRGLYMFGKPLLETYTKHCELVGLFDHNPLRLEAANKLLKADLPTWCDFRAMLREANPDAVIIATRDSTHAEYIIQTLGAGKRAISEKPLCVTAKQARKIIEAQARYKDKGGEVFVTHNMRYGPAITKMKEIIKSGRIGKPLTINFHENLDRRHGADYFRRWHRIKQNSGGLLIHKASHHFDALNWLAESIPNELRATGGLFFYGKNGPFRGERCETCAHAKQCDFYVDMWKNEVNTQLYKEAEAADGYIRDGCVFDKSIDIEDQASVIYDYRNGIQVTYSLTAFASYEGWHIQIEGTGGRIELKEVHSTQWAGGNVAVHGLEELAGESLILFSPKEGIQKIKIEHEEGGHGGADTGIQQDFFGRPFDAELTERMAPLDQAIQAILIGHVANISIAKGGETLRVQSFLRHG